MQHIIPVDFSKFPSGWHSEILASPKTGVGTCYVICSRVEAGCLHSGEETFDHHGRYYDFPGVHWIMQPIQKRIPILWGGFFPQGVARAAERGYHLIAPDVTGTYERVMRERGRQPENYLIGFVTLINIARTREEAFAPIAPHALWVNNTYALRRDLEGNKPPESARIRIEQLRNTWESGKAVGLFDPVAGTVEDIINHTCRSCVASAGSLPISVSRCGHPVPRAKLLTAR